MLMNFEVYQQRILIIYNKCYHLKAVGKNLQLFIYCRLKDA